MGTSRPLLPGNSRTIDEGPQRPGTMHGAWASIICIRHVEIGSRRGGGGGAGTCRRCRVIPAAAVGPRRPLRAVFFSARRKDLFL